MNILEFESNGEWISLDANDSLSVGGKTASGTLSTIEQTNLVIAINELLTRQERGDQELQMLLSMGGIF
jgi:hypothetical protein